MTIRFGREAIVERYRRQPQAGARALFLEAVVRNLNERQALIAGGSAADLVSAAELVDVRARFETMLDECEHAVYEVRQLTRRSPVRHYGRGIARSHRARCGARQPRRGERLTARVSR
jgi:hypothetical protein